jgi:hypothetical protein
MDLGGALQKVWISLSWLLHLLLLYVGDIVEFKNQYVSHLTNY